MAFARHTFTLNRGETFDESIRLKTGQGDPDTLPAKDLTGLEFVLEVTPRDGPSKGVMTAYTAETDNLIVVPADGQVRIRFTDEETGSLDYRHADYKLKWITLEGDVTFVMLGDFRVNW